MSAAPRGADPHRRPALRGARLPGHVARRPGRRARRPEALALPPHRLEGGPALGGRLSEGAEAFHAALDGVPADAPATERIRLALRAHLAVVAGQLDVATVFVREWRYLEGERRDALRRRAPPLRGAGPRPLPRRGRGQRAAHRPRRRDRRAALPLGGELGVHLAAAGRRHRRSSPTGSTRCCSTGCAATRRPDRASEAARACRQRPSSPLLDQRRPRARAHAIGSARSQARAASR